MNQSERYKILGVFKTAQPDIMGMKIYDKMANETMTIKVYVQDILEKASIEKLVSGQQY